MSSGGGFAEAPPIAGSENVCTFGLSFSACFAVASLAALAASLNTVSAALIASGEYLLCCNHNIIFDVVGFSPV